MGWLYQDSPSQGPRQYLDDQFSYTTPTGVTSRVLKSALVSFRTYYAAIEHLSPDGTRVVFAAVCLVDFGPGRTDPMRRFGYKDMDETVGPNEDSCPAGILDLLTPAEHKYALDWRARCRARIAKRKAYVKPKHGDHVHFDSPVYFGYLECSDFVVKLRPGTRTVLFTLASGGGLYRIRNWQELSHTITPALEQGVALLTSST
jgi:hypothetical protein